jgi:DNA-binding transcriptional LysR family regulator
MRPRHLEVFHAVMVTGSVTGAARLLNVSQPAVTKMLFHAEHLIGLRLFDRSGGKILPTADAQRAVC